MKNKKYFIASTILFAIPLIVGILLASRTVAADSAVDTVAIKVPTACTLSTTGSGFYSASVNPGNDTELIGNPISIVCNDNNGYDMYTIGFSGDSYEVHNTDLQTSLGTTFYIHTATSGTDSYWAMKAVGSGRDMPTVDNSFNDYQEIPSSYMKIAHFTGVVIDSIVTPIYKINISTFQPAGNYEGKVKYVIVHPNNAEPPSSTIMQNLAPSKCTSTPTKVLDIRDEKEYHIQRLGDGKCWMLDNLALDLTNSDTQTNLTENTTNASSLALEYLKGERTGTIDDRYATTAVSTIWNNKNSPDYTAIYSYSDPRIFINDAESTSSDNNWPYGVYYNYCAASAGSYCYGDGAMEGISSGAANEDVCPKGWRLPTGGASGEYNTLATAENDIRIIMHLPFSGTVINGSPTLQTSNGSWWASTRDDNGKMHRLNIGSWEVYTNSKDQRSNGASIRCILNS